MAHEIEIQLERVKASWVPGKDDYFKVINEEYLNSYLGSLGVNSNCERSLKRYVSQHAPLAKCHISAAWSDFSAVAETLRIEQPRIVSKERERQEREAAAHARASEQARAAEAGGREEKIANTKYASVLPPEIPGRAERKQHGDNVAVQRSNSKGTLPGLKLAEMSVIEGTRRSQPWTRSQMDLTEELEQMYRKARGRGPVGTIADEFTEEVHRQELAKLQQKYILPFACPNLSDPEGSGEDAAPAKWPIWQLATSVPPLQVPEQLRGCVLEPVKATLEQISQDIRSFIEERLPLRLLVSRPEPSLLAAAQQAASTPELSRLIGLVCHLLYWNMFGHLHEASSRLPDASRQAVEVTIHDLWSSLTAPLRDSAAGGGFVFPVMLLVIKYSVERIFVNQYDKVFTTRSRGIPGTKDNSVEHKLGQQLIVLINVTCMLLLDPDCTYAHFSILDTTPKAIRLWRKIDLLLTSHGRGIANRMRTQSHRTTPSVQMLMRDRARSADAKTRSLLNKSSSDARLAGRTSAAQSDTQAPCLDERKRNILFAAAHRQLAHTNPQSPAVLEFGGGRPPRARSADQRTRAASSTPTSSKRSTD